MKFLAFISQHGYQIAIGLVLSLTLCGVVLVYRQQDETQTVLRQLQAQASQAVQLNQSNDQLITLLKHIQANQADIKTLLTKLSANKTEPNKVPASKMKRFKQGGFKPAKATGY